MVRARVEEAVARVERTLDLSMGLAIPGTLVFGRAVEADVDQGGFRRCEMQTIPHSWGQRLAAAGPDERVPDDSRYANLTA